MKYMFTKKGSADDAGLQRRWLRAERGSGAADFSDPLHARRRRDGRAGQHGGDSGSRRELDRVHRAPDIARQRARAEHGAEGIPEDRSQLPFDRARPRVSRSRASSCCGGSFSQRRSKPHATYEILPGDSVQTDEEILDFWRTESMSVYHPVGSSKMGAGRGPDGSRRQRASRARHRGPPRGGRLDLPAASVRQHARADGGGCGASGGPHLGKPLL